VTKLSQIKTCALQILINLIVYKNLLLMT